MNFQQEKRFALNHALVSNKLKIIIKLMDKEDPKDALNDLRMAMELFRKKAQETKNTQYY
jgi:hypothetical protein